MPFAYYAKLSASRQRIYRRSDAIEALPLPPGVEVGAIVARIRDGLVRDDTASVQRACQALVDALVTGFQVPPIRLRVLAQRPADDYGELHGLYEPEEGRTPAIVHRSVCPHSPRTVVHEVGHHLDYELFKLEETFHTDGFYKRESSLANALLAQEAGATSGSADS